MSKIIGVLWSGGLDSTYLIYKNLSEGNTVYAYYVELENNANKVIEEKKAIEKLQVLFEKYFYNKFLYKGILTEVGINGYDNCLSFKQMPTWIYALQWIDSQIDEVQIGYILNDDALSWLPDIQNIYNSFNAIKTKEIPLTFPLIKISKQQEKEGLPAEFYSNIWYCEDPINGKPCGTCHSCLRYKFKGLASYGSVEVPKYDDSIKAISKGTSLVVKEVNSVDCISIDLKAEESTIDPLDNILNKIEDIKKDISTSLVIDILTEKY